MSLDMTSFEPALKQHYTTWMIENLVYSKRPLFAMIDKYSKFGGELLKMPIIIGNPQNRSASFSNAKAGTTSSLLKAFLLTRVKNYSMATIDNETMLASENNSDAFLRAATVEIDGALDSLGRDLASSLYLSGRGDIGQISSSTVMSGTVATLANIEDIVRFEVGQKIVAAVANSGTITVKQSSGVDNVLSIVALDRDLGTITFSAAMDSFASNDWAQSDYLFVQGDVATGTTSAKVSGLNAWLPAGLANRATVLAAPFFGVTRSVDATRLGGVFRDGSALPIEEAWIDLASAIGREGGAPDSAFTSFKDYRNLIKSLGSKVQYVDVKVGSNAQIGFRGVVINGPRSDISVFPDQDCPAGLGYALEMSTWKLASLGEPVNLFKGDGVSMLRSQTTDGVDIQCFGYSQMGCNAPGHNGVTILPS